MEKELYYDRIIYYIRPTSDEIENMCTIMNQTRSKYKIVVGSEDINICDNSKNRDRLEYLRCDSRNIEYRGLKYCFENFFSSSYFIIRHGDSLDNFKYLIAYSMKNNSLNFIMVNEEPRYYDKLFNKLYKIKNNQFTVGSCYMYMSYRFLNLLFKRNKKITDLSQAVVKLCLEHPEIGTRILNLKGPMSKIEDWKIRRIKIQLFLENSFFLSFIFCIPTLFYLIQSQFSLPIMILIILEFCSLGFMIHFIKKVYYNRVYKGGSDSNE